MHCRFFLLLLGLLALVALISTEENRTELNHVVERVFSRQKRFVLFPKGSNLKFTISLSKGLLSSFPKGVSMTIEQACYFPVPSSREDVYPKRFRPRTTTTAAPLTTTTPTYVWIAGTDWRFKATPLKKPMPLKLHQRIDNVGSTKLDKLSWYGQQYKNYTLPFRHYGHSQKWSKWTTESPKWNNYYGKPQRWSKWTTESPKWRNYAWRKYRSVDAVDYDPETAEYEHVDYPDIEHLNDWRHYHGLRDRRQLFEQLGGFSKLLGIDTKSCVMRAICDSKRLLLPPGYSMLQDIVRLIFTMPTVSGVEDDYSRIMSMDSKDCDREFREQCKLDLLAWFLGFKN